MMISMQGLALKFLHLELSYMKNIDYLCSKSDKIRKCDIE